MLLGDRHSGVLRSRLVRSRHAGVSEALVARALADGRWRPEGVLRTVSDSAAILIRRTDGERGALKLATSTSGMASLRREADMLDRLQSDERLGEWRLTVPAVLESGSIGGCLYLVTSRIPGIDARRATPGMMTWLTPAAVTAIGPLHRVDAAEREVDAAFLGLLVDEPIARLRVAARLSHAVDRLAAALHADLSGRTVPVGWTHGDLALGNVMITDERVSGIIDWGHARENDLAVLDLAFWLLTVPGSGQPREIGARVASRLRNDQVWLPAEKRLLTAPPYTDSISGRSLLLLAWLRHVTDNLAKSDRYARSPVWSRLNVMPVLRLIEAQAEVSRAG